MNEIGKLKSDSSYNSSMFEDYYKDDPNFEGEALYKNRTKKDDALRIKNIVKIFGDGKRAVDNVSFNINANRII